MMLATLMTANRAVNQGVSSASAKFAWAPPSQNKREKWQFSMSQEGVGIHSVVVTQRLV